MFVTLIGIMFGRDGNAKEVMAGIKSGHLYFGYLRRVRAYFVMISGPIRLVGRKVDRTGT